MAPHEDALKADFERLMSVVEGKVEMPCDIDDVTKAYLEEVIEMASKNELGPERKPDITKHHLTEFRRRVNEHTQSSVSGLHYGTYKAAAKDGDIAEAQALQLTLVARSGVHPNRWEKALQMLLAKLKGECSVHNCRYLILYEADFNFLKQYFIGVVANESLNKYKGLPDDVFSRKGGTGIDCKLT